MANRPPDQTRRLRLVALAVGLVLILIVVVAVVVPKLFGHGSGSDAAACTSGAKVTVRGLIGSEKEPFFTDPRVLDRFACAGLTVNVDSRGSRDMVTALAHDKNGYGFAFPGSTATAQKIMSQLSVSDKFTPFSSPMAVATFQPIVTVLGRAQLVRQSSDGGQVLDIAALLAEARKGTTWDRLPGNTEYPVHKTILLSTTDPQDSNSAIMYLSIASQVSNDGAVVTTPEQVRKVLPDLCRLIFDQGDKPETSQVLFNSYLVDGMGRIPMALIYEAQFLTEAPGQKPDLSPDRVLLYPRPTVYSRHTLVPLDDNGRKVGQALRDDPELARLAAEHGFRPERPTGKPGARKPPADVVESPSFDVLESMLTALAPTAENARRCAA